MIHPIHGNWEGRGQGQRATQVGKRAKGARDEVSRGGAFLNYYTFFKTDLYIERGIIYYSL